MEGEDYSREETVTGEKPISDHRRRLKKLLLLLPKKGNSQKVPELDRDRLLIDPPTDLVSKKKGFAAAAFRGLGCTTSSAQVYAPSTTASVAAAAVRSSADWQGKKSRSRRRKSVVKKNERERERERRNQTSGDMWCAPGMGFSVGDASIDCVAPSFQLHRSQSRGRVAAAAVDSERMLQREDLYPERRNVGSEEHFSSLFESTLSPLEAPLFGSDLIFPRHIHRARRIHRSYGGVDEIMMFQTRMMLGEMDMHDRYRDWRLDVDSMTYEDLLELGDRIGYVNTGLEEEDIVCCLRKMKQSPIQCSSTELEKKCSICQEDCEVKDEVGRLDCGHSYHICCIKQWLLRKNACPVCKATVTKS